jgi:exopolysaccharide biosynthesis polyprenyl glycosylphosphotransferase
MPTRFIFQSQGNAVAFIDNRSVYALDGELVGFVDERDSVYDRSGDYKGVLLRDGRVALDTGATPPERVEPPKALERVPIPNVIPHRRPLPTLPARYVESFVVERKEGSEQRVTFPGIAIAVRLATVGFVISTGYYLTRVATIDIRSLLSSPAALATLSAGVAFLALAIGAAMSRRRSASLPRLLVVGEGRDLYEAVDAIANGGEPLGVVVETAQMLDPVFAQALAHRKQIDLAIVASEPNGELHGRGSFLTVEEFVERSTGRLSLRLLNTNAIEQLRHRTRGSSFKRVVKRVFDVVSAVFLLWVASPVMLLAALAIKLESAGPVFYKQTRVGLNGRTFAAVKFRTMRADAESDGIARWAMRSDPRITRVGSFMRKTRIDELPQMISVLRGEMSLVGPRPERPEFVKILGERIPNYELRHLVKPGVTGWAQVRYSYGASLEDAVQKHEFDMYYIKNHSLLLDLQILIETVTVVLFREGSE